MSSKAYVAKSDCARSIELNKSSYAAKPFSQFCATCSQTATRATTYAGGPSLYFWCDDCDVHGMGVTDGELIVVTTFKDALHYGASRRGEQKSVIKRLAEAKGGPARLTQAAPEAIRMPAPRFVF